VKTQHWAKSDFAVSVCRSSATPGGKPRGRSLPLLGAVARLHGGHTLLDCPELAALAGVAQTAIKDERGAMAWQLSKHLARHTQ